MRGRLYSVFEYVVGVMCVFWQFEYLVVIGINTKYGKDDIDIVEVRYSRFKGRVKQNAQRKRVKK